jgi:hypothetical protein
MILAGFNALHVTQTQTCFFRHPDLGQIQTRPQPRDIFPEPGAMRTVFWLANRHSPILTQLPPQANEATPRKMRVRKSPKDVKTSPKNDEPSPSLQNKILRFLIPLN